MRKNYRQLGRRCQSPSVMTGNRDLLGGSVEGCFSWPVKKIFSFFPKFSGSNYSSRAPPRKKHDHND
jgi:hypothetical protein